MENFQGMIDDVTINPILLKSMNKEKQKVG